MDHNDSDKKFHRLSMNTSLKNANIFDDDAWEEDEHGFQIKKEPLLLDNIKQEPEAVPTTAINVSIKEEPCEESTTSADNNKESQLKKELVGDEEESYLDKLNEVQKSAILNSAGKQIDFVNAFNESPFTKELFEKVKIKEETPVKDNEPDLREVLNERKEARKSVKRTIFTRNSPYKRVEDDSSLNGPTLRNRLGPKMSEPNFIRKSPRKPKETETDLEVLQRRQKQIDYGKNTVGYDNYVKLVPKHERKPDDPQTPDKYSKYSRRGWEGLIKQWRIRLHKYDPDEEQDQELE